MKQIVKTIAVLGTGTIGASWAAYFLARGLNVAAHDPAPDAEQRLLRMVQAAWPALLQMGLDPDASAQRLAFHSHLEEAVAVADFVQESGPEDLAAKRALYRRLDDCLDAGVVVASSSSGLRMGELQQDCPFAHRYVIGHPFNPPHLLPLVEVVGGTLTSETTVERAMAFYRAIGKQPIRLRKEVKGHVANRLQAALWREAIYLALEGVATLQEIDAAVVHGPGPRWALMGPTTTFHLGGGDRGLQGFLDHLGGAVQDWWSDLGTPVLDEETRQVLVHGLPIGSGGVDSEDLAWERDRLLLEVLQVASRKIHLP